MPGSRFVKRGGYSTKVAFARPTRPFRVQLSHLTAGKNQAPKNIAPRTCRSKTCWVFVHSEKVLDKRLTEGEREK